MKYLIGILSIASLIGCFHSNSGDKTTRQHESVCISEVAKSYKSMIQITEEPVETDAALSFLCRGVWLEDIQKSRKTNGPHTYTYIHIYMNDLASKAFANYPYKFPAGSVIVKDKSALGYTNSNKEIYPDDGVGGMVKRAPGYDPSHGDWEYFYFTDPSSIESGKIKTCVDCHSRASKTDHVFGHWSKPSPYHH